MTIYLVSVPVKSTHLKDSNKQKKILLKSIDIIETKCDIYCECGWSDDYLNQYYEGSDDAFDEILRVNIKYPYISKFINVKNNDNGISIYEAKLHIRDFYDYEHQEKKIYITINKDCNNCESPIELSKGQPQNTMFSLFSEYTYYILFIKTESSLTYKFASIQNCHLH